MFYAWRLLVRCTQGITAVCKIWLAELHDTYVLIVVFAMFFSNFEKEINVFFDINCQLFLTNSKYKLAIKGSMKDNEIILLQFSR